MTTLIRIGNSQGVRIPKAIIEQAQLENKELVFKISDDGLLMHFENLSFHQVNLAWNSTHSSQQRFEQNAAEPETDGGYIARISRLRIQE